MGDTIMKFVHEKMDAQLLNIEAQLQKVKSDVLEKTEKTSRALTTAIDLIQVDLQDLTSSLQEPPTFTSASMQALLDRRLSDTTVAIERKFADMSSVQSELVEISERCDSETAKLAMVVEQLGSKVANLQTRVATQVLQNVSAVVHGQKPTASKDSIAVIPGTASKDCSEVLRTPDSSVPPEVTLELLQMSQRLRPGKLLEQELANRSA